MPPMQAKGEVPGELAGGEVREVCGESGGRLYRRAYYTEFH